MPGVVEGFATERVEGSRLVGEVDRLRDSFSRLLGRLGREPYRVRCEHLNGEDDVLVFGRDAALTRHRQHCEDCGLDVDESTLFSSHGGASGVKAWAEKLSWAGVERLLVYAQWRGDYAVLPDDVPYRYENSPE